MGARPNMATDKPPHFTMIRGFHLADWFTIANAFCGMGAVLFAMAYLAITRAYELLLGASLRPVAHVLYLLTGRIGRWRHQQSALGRDLNALAHDISIGVAPAPLCFAAGFSGERDALALVYFV